MNRVVLGFALLAFLSSAALANTRAYHSSDRIYGFRKSDCKTASCYEKHPDGTWTHPLTKPKNEL
jgi:hypothetical protein